MLLRLSALEHLHAPEAHPLCGHKVEASHKEGGAGARGRAAGPVVVGGHGGAAPVGVAAGVAIAVAARVTVGVAAGVAVAVAAAVTAAIPTWAWAAPPVPVPAGAAFTIRCIRAKASQDLRTMNTAPCKACPAPAAPFQQTPCDSTEVPHNQLAGHTSMGCASCSHRDHGSCSMSSGTQQGQLWDAWQLMKELPFMHSRTLIWSTFFWRLGSHSCVRGIVIHYSFS